MSGALRRGVARRTAETLRNSPKLHLAVSVSEAALRAEINKKSTFGWGKPATWQGFSANT
jgi:hypothetical protein